MGHVVRGLGGWASRYLDKSYSKAPKSGADPANGRPTLKPALINRLADLSFKNGVFGSEPSALRGPVMRVLSTL